ncbi:MAG: glycosyltransferase [Myxococcota bacterium]
MRVALVHDWLLGMRGGERVLESLCRMFPQAPVHTFFWRPGAVTRGIEAHQIHPSWIDRLPGVHRWHRMALPLLPAAAETLRVDPCDLVVSTSHCIAHAVRAPVGARHLCLCFTPMRYLWGMEAAYLGRGGLRGLHRVLAPPLRRWDRARAARADRIVAISEFVRRRIRRAWGIEAPVLPPPVDVARFTPLRKREDYFVLVSALVPYKRVDLAIEAFRGRREELRIAGSGPLYERLARKAPPNVRLLGWVEDEALPALFGRARAAVFPTEDEFGIAPVEAQAAGTPVIALGRGGALETVVAPGGERAATGLFFDEATPDSLRRALDRFRELEPDLDPGSIRANAERFGPEHFEAGVAEHVSELLESPAGALPGKAPRGSPQSAAGSVRVR